MRVPQKHTVRTSLTPRQKEQARLDEMLQKKSAASKPTSPRTVTPRKVAPKVTPKIPLLNITNRVKTPSTPSAITPKLTQKKVVKKTVQTTSTQTQTSEMTPQIQTTLSPVNALVQKEEELKELLALQSEVKNKIEETRNEIWKLKQAIPSDDEFQTVDLTVWDDTLIHFENPVVEDTPIADFKNFIRDLENATTFEQFEITSVPVLFSAEANAFRTFAENLENSFQQMKESLSLAPSPFSDEVCSFSFPDSAPSSPRHDETISSSLSVAETPSSEANGRSSSSVVAEVVPTQNGPTISLIVLMKILKQAFPNESLNLEKLNLIYEETKDMSVEDLIEQIKGGDRS